MTYKEMLALEAEHKKKMEQDNRSELENMKEFAEFIKKNKCRIKEDNS